MVGYNRRNLNMIQSAKLYLELTFKRNINISCIYNYVVLACYCIKHSFQWMFCSTDAGVQKINNIGMGFKGLNKLNRPFWLYLGKLINPEGSRMMVFYNIFHSLKKQIHNQMTVWLGSIPHEPV